MRAGQAARRRFVVGAAFALTAAALIPAALASALPQARVASAPCTSAQTQVWLGDGEGGGAAGHTYYPLEFSNIGHSSCTLDGYPGVSAESATGSLVGKPAMRNSGGHGPVTLAPGGTAHALISIADWGAICSKAVDAAGLKVYPPSETRAQQISFPFQACAKQGVLVTGPVRAGVGIPGYTTS